MDRDYIVSEVEARKQWNGSYGPMQDYAIKFEGESSWVQLSQKPETPAPEVGRTLHGHIEVQTRNIDGKQVDFKKFKKVNPAYSGGGNNNAAAKVMQVMQNDEDMQYIVTLLEDIHEEVGGNPDHRRKKADNVVQEIDDKPIDLSEIPF